MVHFPSCRLMQIFERAVERAVEKWVERCLPQPDRIVRGRFVNPGFMELSAPLEVPMQRVEHQAPADTKFGYYGWGIRWQNGAGATVSVPVANVAIATSDELVVPASNIAFLGDGYDVPGVGVKDGVFWFNPLDAAATGDRATITFSADETGAGDDVMVDYIVTADRLFGDADGIQLAEATALPAAPPPPPPAPDPAPDPAPVDPAA